MLCIGIICTSIFLNSTHTHIYTYICNNKKGVCEFVRDIQEYLVGEKQKENNDLKITMLLYSLEFIIDICHLYFKVVFNFPYKFIKYVSKLS